MDALAGAIGAACTTAMKGLQDELNTRLAGVTQTVTDQAAALTSVREALDGQQSMNNAQQI